MPFLHWEDPQTSTVRRRFHEVIERVHTTSVHDRRTLDQFYYRAQSQNKDQVMLQYTKKVSTRPKMIMVDQLWLWALDGNTVVTAFPRRLNGAKDDADVLDGLERHLRRGMQPAIKTTYDLVAMIMERCNGVFFQRQLHPDLAFFDFFADSISSVRKAQAHAFESFSDTSTSFKTLVTRKAGPEEIATILDDLSCINQEVCLMSQIKFIQNELEQIDFLCAQQRRVFTALLRINGKSRRSLCNVYDIAEERREAWAGIAQTANQTYQSLQDLMDLKQRQANVSEARSARAQVEVSTRHGRSIMLFTVVTIIFLPMSFLASVFGMNSTQLNNGSNLSIGFILSIIFPISIVITVFALILAFFESLQNFLSRLLGNSRSQTTISDIEMS